jgi:hypothetical protein
MKFCPILGMHRARRPMSRGQILLMVKSCLKNRYWIVQDCKRLSEMLVQKYTSTKITPQFTDIKASSAKYAFVFTVPVCRRAIPYFYAWTSLLILFAQREKGQNGADVICNQLQHHHHRHLPLARTGLHLLHHRTAQTSKNPLITNYQQKSPDLKQTMQIIPTMTSTIKSGRIMRTRDR